MKILVVSHTYIASINREKWKTFSCKYQDSVIKVLIPKIWPEVMFNLEAGDVQNDNLQNCEFIPLDTRKSGNEVLYSYRFLDLIKILKHFKPDLVHVEQGDNALSYFQLILLSKFFSRKTKFTFFTWVNWKNKWSFKFRLIWSFVEKFNLKNSSGAIVGNDDAAKILREKKFLKLTETLLQLGVDQRYFVFEQGVFEQGVLEQGVLEQGVPLEKHKPKAIYKIGFIGRMVKEKGIFDLVDAFFRLRDYFPDWKLVFVGDGKDKKEFINYINKMELNSYVDLLDSVNHEEVGNLLNQFDIFVLPSYDTSEWREQFGHVLIEAMACKIPVIGSTGGEIARVIGDGGLVFEQRNVADLISKLKVLMVSERLRNEFALKGFERFKNNFSYEIIAEKTYHFWCKVLQN